MEVGFIGLGNMGAAMVKSLVRAGHKVAAYNRTRAKAESLVSGASAGVTIAASIADACHCGAVFTMMADDHALSDAAFSGNGILASLAPGGTHICSGTISVALADTLATEHVNSGQHFVSAPVFGRPDAAEAGRLAIVAAGEKSIVDRCKPLLEALGPKLLVIGETPSLANAVKLTGNFMIATVLETLSEAMAFARKSGVDPDTLLEFLTSTLFNAPVYKTYGGLILRGKYEPAGFVLPLGLKDIRLVLQAAEARNVPLPIASVIRDRFLTAIARGYESSDWSVLGQVAAEDAGLLP